MKISDRGPDEQATDRGLRSPLNGRALAIGLLAGTAGCAASPQYPIHMGERAGDGTIMSAQPRYAVSARDAAQNEADRRAQAGYPAYNAPPVGDPAAPPAAADAPEPQAPPPADDMADDAPQPPAPSGGTVDSADLPPPGAPAAPGPRPQSSGSAQESADVPPADPAATPHETSYAYGGGRVVFGLDWVVARPLELAAYRPHRHAKAAADEGEDGAPALRAASGDTPYQTVVKPGETLGEVAERTNSSKAALTDLNDLKHPRHVKPGTVLKIPYRYAYKVQKGDTLYTIAHRFNEAPETLAKLNGVTGAPTLQPGQALQLPPDAADQGKREHASAAGPEPVAAPDKLADAALRKAERLDRRSRTAELNAEAAAARPAREARRGRRRGEETAAAASPAAHPTAPPRVAAAAPVRRAPSETGEASRPATVASAQATGPLPTRAPEAGPPETAAPPPVAPAPEPARSAEVATSTGGPPRYPTEASSSPAKTAAATGVGAAVSAPTPAPTPEPGPEPASAPARSTYVRPSYVPRPAPPPTQYASISPPRYPLPGATSGTPYTPSLGRERPAIPAPSAGTASSSDIASAGRGRFIWPLRGAVVSGFGAKGAGEYNNGVDISAQPGTGVRAAASGDVVYAGSSIPGYGNMVLIKHPGGWVTAYAHLNRIEVRMHDTVSQGDEIGQAGQTGVADRPELYFEVRYAASAADRPRPVDPALVLPAGGG